MPQKSPKRHLLAVVPLTNLPLAREQFLWYEHTEPLDAGTLVCVPLFRRHVSGVITACHDDFARSGGMRLKKISQVLEPDHFTPEQIALAEYLSRITLTSLGTVLRQFLVPDVAARAIHKTQNRPTERPPKLAESVRPIAAEVLSSLDKSKFFLLRDTIKTARDALFVHLIKEVLRRPHGQVLLLLPEVLSAQAAYARMERYFSPRDIALIHHKTAAGTLRRIRNETRNGRLRLLVGTRKAVFLPFDDLRLIIVDEEHDIGFKSWDRAPRFDARAAAEFLSETFRCPLVSVSGAPRVSRLIPRPLGPPPVATPLEICDMRSFPSAGRKRSRQHTLIGRTLQEALAETLQKKKQALLFLNHRGLSRFSICTHCQTLLSCPECDRALVAVKEGHYECLHCPYKTSVFPRCKKCENLTFRNVGFGTQKVQSTIAKLFPQARLKRVDGHSMTGVHAAEEVVRDFSAGKIDILIGTQMALKDWRVPNLRLVGVLDADALLSVPDIYADERLFAHLTNAVSAVTGLRRKGRVIVQTYHPEYALFEQVRKTDYDRFRRQTMRERRALKYPPYWRAVKIIAQHKQAAEATARAEKIRRQLADLKLDTETILSCVHPPLLPKLRGLYRSQIVLRLKNSRFGTPLPPEIEEVLRHVPPHTVIDVDPISLV